MMNNKMPLMLQAVAVCVLWSSAFVAAKVGLRYCPPLLLAGIRFILAGFILLPVALLVRADFGLMIRRIRPVLLVSLFQTVILYACFFKGLTLVQGAQGAIIIGASPLVTAVLSHFFMPGDRLTVKRACSIGVGMLGIIAISLGTKPWTAAGMQQLAGILILFAGVISSAVGNIIVAREKHDIHPVLFNGTQLFIGGWVLLGTGILIGPVPALPRGGEFAAALIWLAVLSAVGFSLWFSLLKKVKVSEVNVWKFIIPPIGAALSWLLLPDESPTITVLAGMLLVAGGIVGFHFSGKKGHV